MTNDSFLPGDFCQNVQVYLIPASSFEQVDTPSISSQVFLPDPPNKYSIIENGKGAVVGQVLSNGIERASCNPLLFMCTYMTVAWASGVLQSTLSLCIPVETSIPTAVSYFPVVAFAKQKYASSPIVVDLTCKRRQLELLLIR